MEITPDDMFKAHYFFRQGDDGKVHVIVQGYDGEKKTEMEAESLTAWLNEQLDRIRDDGQDVKFPELAVFKCFPVTSNSGDDVKTITYYSRVWGGDDDIPEIEGQREERKVEIQSVGASYGYTMDEIFTAYRDGRPLNSRKAQAAHMAIDRRVDEIAWFGDKDCGLTGILSDGTHIPYFDLSKNGKGSTKWNDKSGDEIIEDVGHMVAYVIEQTGGSVTPDTLLLPVDVFIYISAHMMPSKTVTVIDAIKEQYPCIKTIEAVEELTHNSVSTNPWARTDGEGKGVAILYTCDESKVAFERPLGFTQHPVVVKDREIIVLCEEQIAGFLIYYPWSMTIAIGV